MMLNPLVKGITTACRPPDRRPPWQWCEQHVVVDNTSPMPGRWRSDNSPWVRELMEVFADNRVNDIAVKCSAQSSKTQTIINLACWAVGEDPGPAMWVTANIDQMKEDIRDRIGPTFGLCDPVAEKTLSANKLDFEFVGMPFYFRGAGSPAKLQSKPIRWLFLDEVRNYPPGALETVLKRTRAFWNSRRVIISTPDTENDTVDRAFKSGDQRVFHVCCPRCAKMQALKFEQLRWDTNETTKPEGRWDFDQLATTIRYACDNPECGHEIRDTPIERRMLANNGRFIAMNPTAPKNRVSFQWNALLPPWVPWRSIVEEFINARTAARTGDTNPLKTFINETLGESWRDELGVVEDFGFLDLRKADYDFDEAWSEERVRFLAADKQSSGGEHYYYAVRAFGLFGKSRLVAYGRCNTKAELEEIRRQYRVSSNNCLIDSGYLANEVYRFCAATGWKPFKGDDADYFIVRDERTGKTVRQCWTWNWAQPEGERVVGKPIRVRLFRHANPWLKDLLAEFMHGLIGEWTLAKTVGRDYMRQLGADVREERQSKTSGHIEYRWVQKFRENHYKDCEEMILAAAIITKQVSSGRAVSIPTSVSSSKN